jgi:hypothetical protein
VSELRSSQCRINGKNAYEDEDVARRLEKKLRNG